MSYRVPKQHDLQTLIDLGLTLRQAKVYLALAQSGMSTVKMISKVSGVNRPDIYRIMDKLQKLGLAEEIVDTPLRFAASPIQNAVSSLVDHKIKEVYELRQEARELIKRFGEREAETAIREGEKFVLVPGRERLSLWLKRAAENAQSSIDVVCSKEAFPKRLSVMAEVYEKAMDRGVKIRWILEKTEDRNSWTEVQALTKNRFFKLRFLPKSPRERLALFDRKQVFVVTDAKKGALESSALWTNNPSILAIIKDYYELLWITAMKTPHYSTDEKQG